MKKIMMLGGNYFQMTAVKAAKRLGYYVIDVDYLPNNPAHRYADEYHNISTIDREAILRLAENIRIDGILSYASDVSAPTAAYVAENMGLPTNAIETIDIMTDKRKFHPFLKKNNFNSPKSVNANSREEIYDFFAQVDNGFLIKPSHGSGSKGISIVKSKEEIEKAIKKAEKYSQNLVAEEFIERSGYQLDFDILVIDGIIVFFEPGDQHCDTKCNPYVPVGISFPSLIDYNSKRNLKISIESILRKLNFKNGVVNVEVIFGKDGKAYIIELGPRAGGNLIPDAIRKSFDVDLAECAVKSALGELRKEDIGSYQFSKCISSYIWHSNKNGVFKSLSISNELKEKIVLSDLFVAKGDTIFRYENGGYGIGAALLEFNDNNEMMSMMDNMNEFYKVEVY